MIKAGAVFVYTWFDTDMALPAGITTRSPDCGTVPDDHEPPVLQLPGEAVPVTAVTVLANKSVEKSKQMKVKIPVLMRDNF
ncbi:hypothetical protein GCM10023229_14560 [Flavisolibacter ginsenosidimutans]